MPAPRTQSQRASRNATTRRASNLRQENRAIRNLQELEIEAARLTAETGIQHIIGRDPRGNPRIRKQA